MALAIVVNDVALLYHGLDAASRQHRDVNAFAGAYSLGFARGGIHDSGIGGAVNRTHAALIVESGFKLACG